jgi:hypothetical protein
MIDANIHPSHDAVLAWQLKQLGVDSLRPSYGRFIGLSK